MKLVLGLLLLSGVIALIDGNLLVEPPFNDRRPRPRPRPIPQVRTTPPPTNPANPPSLDSEGNVVGCSCPATAEYNPVCGSDGQTYKNPNKMACARRCGYDVNINFLGTCVAG